MSRRGLVLLLLAFPLAAFSQSFSAGATAGAEVDGHAPWVRWEALEAPPLHAFRLDASVPRGSFIIDWEAFAPSWTGLGWDHREEQASTAVTTAFGTPGVVHASWAGTSFDVSPLTPWVLTVDHRWGPGVAGGAAAGINGRLVSLEPFDLGPFTGRAWTAWAGFEGWLGVYGEASGEVSAARNVLTWSFEGRGQAEARWGGLLGRGLVPLVWNSWAWTAAVGAADARLQADLGRNILGQGKWATHEESRARMVAGWFDQDWRGRGWSLGLGTGAALVWVENPTWRQNHSWTEFQYPWWPLPLPVVVLNKTSTSDYTFEASPGWVVVFHPKVVWNPLPGMGLAVSRWLPLSGGIRVAVDGTAPADGATSGPTVLSSWNLWLAGTQVEVLAAW